MELRNIILITIAGFTLSYAIYGKLRNGYDVMQLLARIPFMSHDQIRVKGHVGVTGVKKVIFTKNVAPPTNYVAWSCDLCMW